MEESNFAIICDMMLISAKEIAKGISGDVTMISRWRTGKRKLMPDRHWARVVSQYLINADKQAVIHVLKPILCAMYPERTLETDDQIHETLMLFLTNPGQSNVQYQRRRHELLRHIYPGKEPRQSDPEPLAPGALSGKATMQGGVLALVGAVIEQPTPKRIVIMNRMGLDWLFKDEEFGFRLHARLLEAFERGHRLDIVVGKEYFPSASKFSSRLQVMHAMGYVTTRVFAPLDDPGNEDALLFMCEGVMAARTTDLGNACVTNVLRSPDAIKKLEANCRRILDVSVPQGRMDCFRQAGLVSGQVLIYATDPHYILDDMPELGVVKFEEYGKLFGLKQEECDRIRNEFGPAFLTPAQFGPGGVVRHVYCKDAIDEFLAEGKPRLVHSLSQMIGRPVYMTPAALLKQLRTIRAFMRNRGSGFEVAFLPREIMGRPDVMLSVWGNALAVGGDKKGWFAAYGSEDVVKALMKYCDEMWEHIPQRMSSHAVSGAFIDRWLDGQQI